MSNVTNLRYGSGSAVGKREKKAKLRLNNDERLRTASGVVGGAWLGDQTARAGITLAETDGKKPFTNFANEHYSHQVRSGVPHDTALKATKGALDRKLLQARGAGVTAGGLLLAAAAKEARRWRDPKKVYKSDRVYDYEDSRQRRVGGAAALLGAGSLLLGGKGAYNIARTSSTKLSRNLRTTRPFGRGATKAERKKYNDTKLAWVTPPREGRAAHGLYYLSPEEMARASSGFRSAGNAQATGRNVVASRRDLAMLAGGTAGLAGTKKLNEYADDRRNRRWT